MRRNLNGQGDAVKMRNDHMTNQFQNGERTRKTITLDSDGEYGNPIVLESNSDDETNQPISLEIPSDEDDHGEISHFQELEIQEIDQANEIMKFVQASLNDPDTSDEEDNPSNNDDEPVQALFWSIFEQNHTCKSELLPPQRFLKSGKNGYQKPLANPNANSARLIPASAIGKNNNLMSNWLQKANTSCSSTQSNNPSLEESISSTASPQVAQVESIDNSVSLRLEGIQNEYLSTPKTSGLSKSDAIKLKANTQWDELKRALNSAAIIYKKKAAQDKKYRYPEAMLANLSEFNYLRKLYTLKGLKNPSLTASKEAAQSSIRRYPSSQDTPENQRSGLHLARIISKQASHIVINKQLFDSTQGNRSNHKSLIDNIEIRQALFTWAASQIPGEVTPATFQRYVVETLLPRFGIEKNLVRSTITRWMVKLGFTPQVYRKSLYFDGHERPDVVASRKKYIEDYKKYRSRSRTYGGEDLDFSAEIDPELLGDNKETVFIFHDESTVHAKERPRLAWLLPGTSEIRSKNAGRLIHISDFILETTGRLHLSPDEFRRSQNENGTKPESNDAATVIYPGSNGDKWWDMDQLCHQVARKAIPIFETTHPNSQAIFIFDCSSAHGAYSKSALRVQNMNLNPGGKQSILRDTLIPTDDPCIPFHLRGQPQTCVFDHSHPQHPGKAKGIRAILEERGLWSYYSQKMIETGQPALKLQCKACATSNIQKDIMRKSEELIRQAEANGYFLTPAQSVEEAISTTQLPQDLPIDTQTLIDEVSETNDSQNACCWSKILSLQSDFRCERPLLQTIIEDAGHICLFLPKFHCELNPIELFWSFIKIAYRKESHKYKSFADCKEFFNQVRQSCPLTTIRKYFRRIDRQISVYEQGYNGPQGQILMKKYTSHRCIPRQAAMRIDVLTG
ncbi:uncharacterized protein PGTG_11309 [Puccinia graminis f. sp. tritici CRL 75-36-700-3]|uniref:Tc1-like transposase DDE domain-containing protein n=1 Tax=Puccinia graminis f. sp. tritici (strain CRL 75-36-700-3 / race SCCL) TaxID=418459 RepID=E3KLG5_PUCGT|nr:uncharacterized protein PGTG_11309 [Puccinia graminis f. sp. tritici CRL 75-36-700-3]EFP85140.2 hypothetical protein PGTG_11309 [Puccinia graminis f. sp. tritici CRL 75-36-700-3]